VFVLVLCSDLIESRNNAYFGEVFSFGEFRQHVLDEGRGIAVLDHMSIESLVIDTDSDAPSWFANDEQRSSPCRSTLLDVSFLLHVIDVQLHRPSFIPGEGPKPLGRGARWLSCFIGFQFNLMIQVPLSVAVYLRLCEIAASQKECCGESKISILTKLWLDLSFIISALYTSIESIQITLINLSSLLHLTFLSGDI
jgi:hypothetical protein